MPPILRNIRKRIEHEVEAYTVHPETGATAYTL